MSTEVEVLSNMVYITHNGVQLGIPKEAMEVAMQHPKLNKLQPVETTAYMQIQNCPSCGIVPTASGTCGYCGSKCE